MSKNKLGSDSFTQEAAEGTGRRIFHVLGVPIDALTMQQTIERIRSWAARHESRVVVACNVHSVVIASRDEDFMGILAAADLVMPDGAPLAWTMRRLGAAEQRRVAGPDLMLNYCEHAATAGESIYLYGSSETTLMALAAKLRTRWPELVIAGTYSPPDRALTSAEDEAAVQHINDSGAATVWVSLGCPKQELWMAAHRDRVRTVMVGVGAAFDFHAGTVRRAPRWIRDHGLEWLYRMACEPRRLALRYLLTNPVFLVGVARQLLLRPNRTRPTAPS